MSRCRVLVVSEPMEYGVLSYLEQLFAGIDRRRFEPGLVYSPNRVAPQGHAMLARLAAEGVHVRSLPFQRGLGLSDFLAARQLRREIAAFRPDVLHLHSTKAGLFGRLLGRLAGVPVLYTAHGTSWHYTGRIVGRIQLALERRCRSLTDLLVAVCPEEAQTFITEVGFAPERVRVVRNGVRLPDPGELTTHRARLRRQLGLADGERWGLFLARLTREKGLDVLLAALADSTGLAGLLVVGDGRDRVALEAAAREVRIPVRFLGYHADVSPFLAAADVFVQPSRSEGLPFGVLEAMAHGLPIVATAVGGVAPLLEGCGRLVAPEDPAALAAAIRTLVEDADERRRLGERARRRIETRFGVPAMLAGVHAAYEDAAAGRSAVPGAAAMEVA